MAEISKEMKAGLELLKQGITTIEGALTNADQFVEIRAYLNLYSDGRWYNHYTLEAAKREAPSSSSRFLGTYCVFFSFRNGVPVIQNITKVGG